MKDLDKDRNRENITRAEFFKIILLFPIKIILTILKKVFTIPFLTMLGIWILVYFQFASRWQIHIGIGGFNSYEVLERLYVQFPFQHHPILYVLDIYVCLCNLPISIWYYLPGKDQSNPNNQSSLFNSSSNRTN